jgi:hypothetical protein
MPLALRAKRMVPYIRRIGKNHICHALWFRRREIALLNVASGVSPQLHGSRIKVIV